MKDFLETPIEFPPAVRIEFPPGLLDQAVSVQCLDDVHDPGQVLLGPVLDHHLPLATARLDPDPGGQGVPQQLLHLRHPRIPLRRRPAAPAVASPGHVGADQILDLPDRQPLRSDPEGQSLLGLGVLQGQ